MPQKICKLKNLQTLSTFVVGKDDGSRMRELRDMLQLHGSLLISGLQNVVSFSDAMEANLKEKQELDQLVLQWSNSFEASINDVDEKEESKMRQILKVEKDLSITGYSGRGFPSLREAMKASTQERAKRPLRLSSSLDDSRNETVETDVLEMLQPHKNMKQIIINDYGGTKFPSWFGSPMFSNLILLRLSGCRK